MTNLSVFALGVLALLAVWKFMLRPSIQDTYKDHLFDVRDRLRSRFAEQGQLDTNAYRELRDTLNRYIRFIEVANLSITYQFAVQMGENPRVADRYLRDLDRRFDVDDPRLARLARASRQHCSRTIQFYVFHSSLLSVVTLYLILLPMAIGHALIKFFHAKASRSSRALWLSVIGYIQDRENSTIAPFLTELFSQVDSLRAV